MTFDWMFAKDTLALDEFKENNNKSVTSVCVLLVELYFWGHLLGSCCCGDMLSLCGRCTGPL